MNEVTKERMAYDIFVQLLAHEFYQKEALSEEELKAVAFDKAERAFKVFLEKNN